MFVIFVPKQVSLWKPVPNKGGSNRVKRGGSWNNNARNCRSANRNNNTPGNRNNNLGFRLMSTGVHSRIRCFGETEYPWDDRTAMRAALAEYLGVNGPEMPYLPTS